jgi:segregation and condensation protein B
MPAMPHNGTDLNQLEAVLFASEHAVPLLVLRQVLGDHSTRQRVIDALQALQQRYAQTALELVETASGYRMQVRAQHGPMLAALWPERPMKLSPALLETLTVIAYRQPVTRGDIEQLRGVTVNSQILRTLFDRQWIVERGHRDVAGRPALLVTTRQFLDAFGLRSLAELPPLGDTVQHLSAVNLPMATEHQVMNAQQDSELR